MKMITTSLAHPNIAFIKYWGNRDQDLRLPANGSISMNLAALETRTSLEIRDDLSADSLFINDKQQSGSALQRVQAFLDILRGMSNTKQFAEVRSHNNFPTSAGMASSAAAFAALAAAGAAAYGLDLSERELSRLSRRGSGSACRSIPSGFVEWLPGTSDEDSYARSIAAPDHWDLWDCVAVVESGPKETGSSQGHKLASSSPLQTARVADAPRRLDICRQAIQRKDFEQLADIIELDSDMMHAVMMTSNPPLMYWEPASLRLMKEIRHLRKQGLSVAYTLDAGPNVHAICTAESLPKVEEYLSVLPQVQQILTSPVGPGVKMLDREN